MSLSLLLASCAPYNTGRLDQAVGSATQEDMRQGMGPPQAVRSLPNGDTEWVYYDRGSATVGYTGAARSKTCRELVLVFDPQAVLRAWKQQPCQPEPVGHSSSLR